MWRCPARRPEACDRSGRVRTALAEVAADLGLSDQTVYNWWNQHLIDTGRKPGVSSTDNAELAAARKRIAELETELAAARQANELLKAVMPPKRGSRRRRTGPSRGTYGSRRVHAEFTLG